MKYISCSHKSPYWQWREGGNSLLWGIQGRRLMEPLPALIQDFDKAEWEECFTSFGARRGSCVITPACDCLWTRYRAHPRGAGNVVLG